MFPLQSLCSFSLGIRMQDVLVLLPLRSDEPGAEREEARAGGLQGEAQSTADASVQMFEAGAEVTTGCSPPDPFPVSCSQALPVLL